MSVTDLVQRVIQGRQERKAAAVQDFAGMVVRICDGQEPVADEVDRLLTETGKTTDELAAAVKRRQTRLELAALKATLPGLRKQLTEVADKLNAQVAKHNAEITRHNEIVQPLFLEARALDEKIANASGIDDKLRASYRGPLKDVVAGIEARRAPLHQQKLALHKSVDYHVTALREAEQMNKERHGKMVSEGQIESHRRVVENYKAQISPLDEQIRALDLEEKQAYAAMAEV